MSLFPPCSWDLRPQSSPSGCSRGHRLEQAQSPAYGGLVYCQACLFPPHPDNTLPDARINTQGSSQPRENTARREWDNHKDHELEEGVHSVRRYPPLKQAGLGTSRSMSKIWTKGEGRRRWKTVKNRKELVSSSHKAFWSWCKRSCL